LTADGALAENALPLMCVVSLLAFINAKQPVNNSVMLSFEIKEELLNCLIAEQ
jgi:hypothetical protein